MYAGSPAAVSFTSMLCAWKTTPISRRTPVGSNATSWPMIVARPPEGSINVERMRNMVVLPLPLGPSSPKISAVRTSNDTPSSAVRSSYG